MPRNQEMFPKITWIKSMKTNANTTAATTPTNDGGDAGVSDEAVYAELELGATLEGDGDEAGEGEGDETSGPDAGDNGDDDGDGEEPEGEEAGDGEENDGAEGDDDGEGDGESNDDGDGEGDGEDNGEGDGEAVPHSVKQLQKRVNKLTAQKKDLETVNLSLTEQLRTASPNVLQPTVENPLANLMTVEAVQERESALKLARRWCRENPEGGMVEINGKEVEFDAEAVRKRLAAVEDMLEEAVPKRLKFLEEHAQVEAEAKLFYPELYDPNSAASKVEKSFLSLVPEFLNLPNYKLIIGDAMRGYQARLAEAKAKTAKKPAPTEKPKAKGKKEARAKVRTSEQPPRVKTDPKKASNAEQRFLATGSSSDLAGMIESGALG